MFNVVGADYSNSHNRHRERQSDGFDKIVAVWRIFGTRWEGNGGAGGIMKRFLIGLGLCLGLATAASAQSSSYDFASSFGMVLASESACGLTFKQEAIDAYVADNVAADDIEFPQFLSAGISMGEYRIKEFSKTARAAHCAQVRRIALSYGFIQEGDFQIGVPASK